MVQLKILIVEDDVKTAATIRLYLEHAGFTAFLASDGAQAMEMIRMKSPALLILDLMLPRVDGLNVCSSVREFSDVPIIMLTARAEEEDKLKGLHLGADDYITKPFSPRELVARVQTVLRRTHKAEDSSGKGFHSGDLTIDFTRHQIHVNGSPVDLTPTEFKLLETLTRAPGRVFTRAELVERAFGPDFEGLDRTVDAHVMNLRRKIEPNRNQPSRIVTVFGVGYKFSAGQNVS